MLQKDFETWTTSLIEGIREFTLAHNGHPFIYFAVTRQREHILWFVDDNHLLENRDLLAQMMMALNIGFDTDAYAVAFEAWGLLVDPRTNTFVAPSQSERRQEVVQLVAFSADGADRVWHGEIERDVEGQVTSLDETGLLTAGMLNALSKKCKISGRFAGLYPPGPINPTTRETIRELVLSMTSLRNICVATA
jgi:hypothetical protein